MKIVVAADLHLTSRQPEFWRESARSFSLSVWESLLRFVATSEADALVIAGDLFDTWHPGFRLLGDFEIALRKASLDVPIFAVAGNHDTHNGELSSLSSSALGYLVRQKRLTLLSEKKAPVVGGCALVGTSYSRSLVARTSFFYESDLPVLWFVHGFFLAGEHPFPHCKVTDVHTNARVFCCGHYHLGYPPVLVEPDTIFAGVSALTWSILPAPKKLAVASIAFDGETFHLRSHDIDFQPDYEDYIDVDRARAVRRQRHLWDDFYDSISLAPVESFQLRPIDERLASIAKSIDNARDEEIFYHYVDVVRRIENSRRVDAGGTPDAR